jgi:hypothetical protein
MPVDRDLMARSLGQEEDDPVAWSLRLQALLELRALSDGFGRDPSPARLT